ncbi:MAG TPA: tRNA adenosine(34) deaminase TadA [Armatimonadota bacterium]|nr:tRNA adenosine(34) deaminase TadA [Armatimonadota bacterium]HQK91906.1 tRNA adenosine(34) deaminase TadA [Armatimonadota bacterium]
MAQTFEAGPCGASEDPAHSEALMALALAEAEAAPAHGDVPIGAIVVHEGEVIARAHNRRDVDADPTAHAEILALRAAAKALGTWYLTGCELYVTLEPCAMCAGALVLARVRSLTFGAPDPKAGACGSVFNLVQSPRLNHRLEVSGGVLGERCAEVLSAFFEELRASKAN